MLTVAYSPLYHHPLPQGHRFPMEKYSLLPIQLEREGIIEKANFFEPDPIEMNVITDVHHEEYLNRLLKGELHPKEERKIGFKYSKRLVERELLIVSGTVQNALFAQEYGCSLNIAGGTHHAYADHGEGFCLLNDIAVAARYLINQKLAKKILVIDLDVHQGNGTAKIFENDSSVYTFSMHGASNYPLRKENSDRDIDLRDGTNDQEYLNILRSNIQELFMDVNPDFVFFQSGVDVLGTDHLGKLNLTMSGCKQRDLVVFEACKNMKTPVAVSMGGGYSKDISIILEAHSNTFEMAREVFGD